MTVKTSLSFTDRHHRFLAQKVAEGVFASTSAAVAAGVERMIEDEAARETALASMEQEIRRRYATPPGQFVDLEDDGAFDAARAVVGEKRA